VSSDVSDGPWPRSIWTNSFSTSQVGRRVKVARALISLALGRLLAGNDSKQTRKN
jgi:hypothetical protein